VVVVVVMGVRWTVSTVAGHGMYCGIAACLCRVRPAWNSWDGGMAG